MKWCQDKAWPHPMTCDDLCQPEIHLFLDTCLVATKLQCAMVSSSEPGRLIFHGRVLQRRPGTSSTGPRQLGFWDELLVEFLYTLPGYSEMINHHHVYLPPILQRNTESFPFRHYIMGYPGSSHPGNPPEIPWIPRVSHESPNQALMPISSMIFRKVKLISGSSSWSNWAVENSGHEIIGNNKYQNQRLQKTMEHITIFDG